jgi:hypothetical protein
MWKHTAFHTLEEERVINAAEYSSLQAAVSALPATGGTIYLPRRFDATGAVIPYDVAATILVTKPVSFVGDGVGRTIIRSTAANPNYVLFDVSSAWVRFAQLTIDGRSGPTGSGTKDCVQINGLGVSGRLVLGCSMEDVEITNAGRNALRTTDVISFVATNCSFVFSKSDGAVFQTSSPTTDPPGTSSGSTTLRLMACYMSQNGGRGAYVDNVVGMTFFGCIFEGNDGGSGTADAAGLYGKSSARIELIGCYFEDPPNTTPAAEQFVYLWSCSASVVDASWFMGAAFGPQRAAYFANCHWARFLNNAGENFLTEFVLFDSECNGAVEFGNREIDAPAPLTTRVNILGRGVLSHNTGATNLGRFFENNRPLAGTVPGKANPGSLLWLENPTGAQSNLQISDGTVWRNIPVLAGVLRTRSFELQPGDMLAGGGAPTRGSTGTDPDAFDRWSLTGGADRTVLFSAFVPADWIGGSVTVKVYYVAIAGAGDASGFMVDFGYLALADGDNPTAAASVVGPINLATTAPRNSNLHVVTLGTFSTGVAAGKLLRCYVKRDFAAEVANGGGANLQTLGLVAVRMEYTTEL